MIKFLHIFIFDYNIFYLKVYYIDMKHISEDYIWKCPNCDSENFNIKLWICYECWYWVDYYDDRYTKVKKNKKIIKNTEKSLKNVFFTNEKEKRKKMSFNFDNYESYRINIIEGKISEIKYKYNYKKYKVQIDYNLKKIKLVEKRFFEPENSDEYSHKIIINKINKLKIIWVWKKVKVWYWEKIYLRKDNFNSLVLFVKKLLEEYYNRLK